MALKGIDIAIWQRGIDLAKVPADFVIVKATEGTGYVNDQFNAQINGANRAGRLLGVYHYINGTGAAAEMRHFYNAIKPWIGKAIICLDWESGGNSKWGNNAYLAQCVTEIKKLTGKAIVIYASQSAFPWDIARSTGSKAWVAQYASDSPINGYQDKPWNEGKYTCFIRQYSGNGHLPGYNGALDLDKAYCTKEEWNKLAGKVTTSKPSTKKPIDTIAKEVIDGKWGNGETRKKKLTAAGYDYNAVQKRVNEMLKKPAKKSTDTLAKEIIAGKWGNEPNRSKKLKAAGYTTAEIQAAQKKVNKLV